MQDDIIYAGLCMNVCVNTYIMYYIYMYIYIHVWQRCETRDARFRHYYLTSIEELVREAVEDLEEGIKVGGRWIKALRFADDQAMVAKSQKGLQAMMDRLDRTSREYGMKINTKKTKVLKISKGKETGQN